MASFHRCQNCGCETEMPGGFGLGAFEDNPHCRQCGLSATESESKMQEELVSMMSRHLQLNPASTDASMPPTPQVSPHPAPITYITQHYHHSAHQVPAVPDVPVSIILEEHGVDPSALLPSQLSLFKNADDEQKLRLIELWRIAPPQFGKQLPASQMSNWPETSMEQEEAITRHRWEEMERERLKNLCASPGYGNRNGAEPYIVSGYSNSSRLTEQDEQQHVEYKHCKDPVYNQSREWWNLADREPMEHQYGMFMLGREMGYEQKQQEDTDMW